MREMKEVRGRERERDVQSGKTIETDRESGKRVRIIAEIELCCAASKKRAAAKRFEGYTFVGLSTLILTNFPVAEDQPIYIGTREYSEDRIIPQQIKLYTLSEVKQKNNQ